uniref:Uncharacterized protein n=1 Tax=Onchocerca volvulus TaxID=6282 RepID=A0A8R1TPT5_ONCVO
MAHLSIHSMFTPHSCNRDVILIETAINGVEMNEGSNGTVSKWVGSRKNTLLQMTVPKRSHSIQVLSTIPSISSDKNNSNKNNNNSNFRFNFCHNPIGFVLNSFVKRREATICSDKMRKNSKENYNLSFLDNYHHVTMTNTNSFKTWKRFHFVLLAKS